ncbi:hypothetical protein [Streptomyces sp. RTd22]|uniref:hypothetical protein n=1 Tax=Streptomyces sp. RTd22 TaxID=1841249 RepID=UPI0007C4E734|nr:hypothetical protein [Streptomyces sp. RTd22]
MLTVLLTGCANTEGPSDARRPAATGDPSTAPGVDGEADPKRVFTEAELKAALPPAGALGRHAKVVARDLGHFGGAGGDWSQCAAGYDLRMEVSRFRAASVQQTVHRTRVAENDRIVTVLLASMPAGRSERQLEIQRRLHEICPNVTVDTEAAPVQEHRQVEDVAALGDEALLKSVRQTGGDEYDGTPSYTVDVRVGGVLVIVMGGGDKETCISYAARTAQWIRAELYAAGGTSG